MIKHGQGRWQCQLCGKRFDREKQGKRVFKFCSLNCRYENARRNGGNAGTFKSGQLPWNKGIKGIHLSPATEWKKGQQSNRKLPVGSVRIRQRNREQYPRAFIKVAEPSVWRPRAAVVWEAENGPVPRGYLVHHRDRDTLNDSIANLELLSRSAHALEHNCELHEARYGSKSLPLEEKYAD